MRRAPSSCVIMSGGVVPLPPPPLRVVDLPRRSLADADAVADAMSDGCSAKVCRPKGGDRLCW